VLSDPEVMVWWSSGPHASLAETDDYVKGNAAEGQGFFAGRSPRATMLRSAG
jgi:ribosomal-protein-alanine N-acetyltransferase